jgi:hypothetical protein
MASSFFGSRRQASRKSGRRSTHRRRAFFEQLEDRRLLAADWHNALVATDVNADRRVSPIDGLMVINMLESEGSLQLPEMAAGAHPNAYYDTSGDGFVSPVDALLVINAVEADNDGYTLTDITSLSDHYIQATFDAPVLGALYSPDAYILTGPDSSRLEGRRLPRVASPRHCHNYRSINPGTTRNADRPLQATTRDWSGWLRSGLHGRTGRARSAPGRVKDN